MIQVQPCQLSYYYSTAWSSRSESLTGRRAVRLERRGMRDSLSHTLAASRTEQQQTRYSWGSMMSWPDMNRSRYLNITVTHRLMPESHLTAMWTVCVVSPSLAEISHVQQISCLRLKLYSWQRQPSPTVMTCRAGARWARSLLDTFLWLSPTTRYLPGIPPQL